MLAGRKQSIAPLSVEAQGATVETLLSSSEYREFAEEDFDPTQYATRVIQAPTDSPYHGLDITTSLAKLSFGIDHLNKHIQEQVSTHYEDLLQQVSGLSDIEGILASVKQGVHSLNTSLHRVRDKVLTPYQDMQDRTLQLERIQTTAEILRRLIRFMYLLRRLDVQLPGGERELPKAALTVCELIEIAQDPELDGIDIVDAEKPGVMQAKQKITTDGEELLHRGMAMQNQTDIAAGLQVFFNLNQLAAETKTVCDGMLHAITQEMQMALDPVAVNREIKESSPPRRNVGSPAAIVQAVTPVKLWTRVEHLMDVIYDNANKVYQMYRVLKRKKDSATHKLFADEVAEGLESDLLDYFWRGLSTSFERELRLGTKSSQGLLHEFQTGYPRLLRLVHNVFTRLSVANGADFSSDGQIPDSILVLQSLSPLETSYLSRSLSRLLEPINAAFPDRIGLAIRMPPSRDDVDKVIRTLGSELEAAKFDPHLLQAVARNASKAIKMYWTKCEQYCNVDANLQQIVTAGTATHGQLLVIESINCLWYMQDGVYKVLTEFSGSGLDDTFNEILKGISRALQGMVEPLFSQITREFESSILKIHKEDLASRFASPTRGQSESSTSQYVGEFASKVRWVHRELLSKLQCGDESREWIRSLGRRIVEYFLRHASLVRPADEGVGRLLASDMTHLEFVLSQWFAALGMKLDRDLGDSYKALRAFRHMPFLDIPQVTALRTSQNVPPSIIIHHLLARAHPHMPFPTLLYAWSEAQYSDWLDARSEDEALQILARCLDAYAAEIRQKGGVPRPEYNAAVQMLKEIAAEK
ncbi:Golgi transport complex subunit 5-domain-containing protein [Fimicolochytrium jonesii]|uniref:Golgi transport complex subunit 5-domain-containing protein n=1 Tax=Fimicolochytrium jonesii TaxID=1396493 RepID=UPI0022FEBCF6|nr:Golgi transport complex subunit 5-domain-containing protein [Fimicolochytrium jonesii]KAI8823667.1 Golgi transport complex subunit 5-domain-containing protein [Fimicolochytrium jonesii]